MPLWLSESDVRSALPMVDLIDAMERALIAFSAGRVVQPVRTVMEFRPGGFFGLMPALDPDGLLGAKILTVLPENLEAGLPSHQASILLFDPASGALLAVADGRYITEARTAAVSAVSVRHLARRDAKVLAILGSGVQAHSHMEALPLVHDFREIRAWSPNAARLHKFASHWNITAAHTAEQAVRGADVIVLATSSATPVIEDEWVHEGAHVIAVGACRANMREAAPRLVARSLLVVDSRAAAMKEAGDILLAIQEGHCTAGHIHAELGEIAAARKSGRRDAAQVTFFKSLGLAIEDVVSAGLAYRRAVECDGGVQVPL
ncbi:MAG TPA: ornithine cyclodeaminase family protein [Candidatus Solibacter sp.]|jgi:ornithine cyclodeaminase/alanine dehydrogenase-like protein (mu-crystallin family)